jgi:ABC-type transporter Mla subunit MlaD
MLRSMQRDLQHGGDGREASEATRIPFPWLEWINRIFPNTGDLPGSYSRDDAIKELDTQLSSDSDYLLLQRLGVAAPLLGVILTVAGFAWLEVPENSESLDNILLAVMPLVAGVGAGAILAFINQFLLHLAGNKVEAFRMTARTWFDSAVWSGARSDRQAATDKSLRTIERMVESIGSLVDQHVESTGRLVVATTSIQNAGASLHDAVDAFGHEMTDVPESLAGLNATAAALKKLIPIGQRAVAGLDVSVSAFRSAVENDFVEAASLQNRAVGKIDESIVRLGDATELLRNHSVEIKSTVGARHDADLQTLSECIQQLHDGAGALAQSAQLIKSMLEGHVELGMQITPIHDATNNAVETMSSVNQALDSMMSDVAAAQRNLREGSESFSQSASQLVEFFRKLEPPAWQIEQLDRTLQRMTDSVGAMQEFSRMNVELKQLTGALCEAATVVEAISELPDRIRDILEEFAPAHNNTPPRGPIMGWFQGGAGTAASSKRKAH